MGKSWEKNRLPQFFRVDDVHHHHHLSLNREGRWGTTDDFNTSFLHFSLFSTALCYLANSRPVHSLILSSHLFLCVMTLIRWPFHPHVTSVARKRPRSFCRKCRWQVTHKHAYNPWPNKVGVGRLYRRPGIVWAPIRKRAHTQLVREHTATIVSARWATVDWSWHLEWN